ncbi:hypothetical protein LCGC14_0224090 [marine sediment metagenome]|uniref:Uncharacterized protein n=1 Tax=marine sediment metagenome TaxID=412755 RepID=A0A0F9WWS6_9ZZZZ
MTFPIVEILCNECGKSMMVSKPAVIASDKEGYDKLVIFRYVCATDRKSVSMRMYIPDIKTELASAGYTTMKEDWTNKEEQFEDLSGNKYDPVIINGVYICPKCKGVDGSMISIFSLHSQNDDPDYFHYRCPNCFMDFKIENKPTKDFSITF